MKIDCKHWQNIGQRTHGVCSLGYFGGSPSCGTCLIQCRDYTGNQRPHEAMDDIAAMEKAQGKTKPKVSLRKYLKAELSLLTHGPVPLTIYEHRGLCCTGPKGFNSPCAHWKQSIEDMEDDVGFCGSCGCGGRERAKLSTKLHMPKATCPKGIWGEEKGEGILQLARIGGIVKQVKSIIKGVKDEMTKEAKDGE